MALHFDSRRGNLIAICYLAAVVVSAVFAFWPNSLFNFGWFSAVTCLTLPWGLITWFFIWGLIHDNTHYFAMSLHIAWGILNVLLALRFAERRRRSRVMRDDCGRAVRGT
jgi:hypothetical protein